MFANRIHDVDLINRIHLHVDVEDRVARCIRVSRRNLFTIDKGRIVVEDLVGLTVPPCAVVLTAVNVDRGVIRMNDSEVQAVVLKEHTGFLILYRAGVDTRGIESVVRNVRTLVNPYIRIFLIGRRIFHRIRSTDRLLNTHLLNDMENTDAVAAISRLGGIAVVAATLNGVIAPDDRLALMQYAGFRVLLDRRNKYL